MNAEMRNSPVFLNVGICLIVGEHSVLLCSAISNVLRAHTVRPYGYTSANDFGMGTHVLPSR